jgi:hypothetical protein
MEHVSSIMALAAAPELLDQNLLLDAAGPPVANQAAGRASALVVADQYRQQNNALLPASQRIDAGDVAVQTGFVADVTAGSLTLDPAPAEHNSVYVTCDRAPGGSHPVTFPIDLRGTVGAVDIHSGACATLDNLLVGFRPEPDLPAQVLPVAVQDTAWATERTTDSNGNGILEMVLRWQAVTPPADAPQLPAAPNAALLFFGGAAGEQALAQVLPQQVAQGLFISDLPAAGQLGPATPAAAFPVLATQQADDSDAGTWAIQAALSRIVGQKRVLPVFSAVGTAGPDGTALAQLNGFVACVILGAAIVDHRLAVRVEPCYLIQPTAWTVGPNDASGPQRNLYVYKLRLAR